MNESKMPVRVVVYQEGEGWVARCLEFDVVGEGENYLDALLSLRSALALRVKHTLSAKDRDNLFTPAAGKYFQMFAVGKHVPAGGVLARIPPGAGFSIDRIIVRQYIEGERSRG
jgi:hypothetical protein